MTKTREGRQKEKRDGMQAKKGKKEQDGRRQRKKRGGKTRGIRERGTGVRKK